jgi:hypothetical protein
MPPNWIFGVSSADCEKVLYGKETHTAGSPSRGSCLRHCYLNAIFFPGSKNLYSVMGLRVGRMRWDHRNYDFAVCLFALMRKVLKGLVRSLPTHNIACGFSTVVNKPTECAYGLRFVEFTNREGKDPWSPRQTVVYHRLKPNPGSSTWILVTPSEAALLRLGRYVKSCQDLSLRNPFELHLLLLDTALANWRPYMVSLTESVNNQVTSSFFVIQSCSGSDKIQGR